MIGSLYIKTLYSMLNSTLDFETIFKAAVNNKYDFIAMTDSNLHGLYKFLKKADKYNIKPIIGLDIKLLFNEEEINLTVYARNDYDLKKLINLSTLTSLQSKNDLDSLLSELVSLVVVLPINQNIIFESNGKLEELLSLLKKKISSFYLGIIVQDNEIDHNYIKQIIDLNKLKILPLYQINYLKKEDNKTYDILQKISGYKDNKNISNYFIETNEMINLFSDYPNIFKNIKEVFSNTNYSYGKHKFDLPIYPSKDGVDSNTYLKALTSLGLKKRLEKNNNTSEHLEYQKRLTYELEVISKMGYQDYFLIVYDFVKYAKNNNILVGPGRGSAAGSLVSYCLGITEVDPIKYGLMFERFLNIDRISMPDIDLDFPDNKRDIVIDYVKNKYGKKHVVTITTFTTFAEKSSMRDIARILNMPQSRINGIIQSHAKGILDPTDNEAKELIEIAKTIEGLIRQTGTHPAGVILSKDDLSEYVPLTNGPHEMYQSQFEASDLEDMGFLKIDFLGLRNLSMIEEILSLEKNEIKLSEIPFDDLKTFELLQRVDVNGIFQLESNGMRNVIRKLKPSNFEDIVALLALFRPGPMQFIEDYIARRHGASYDLLDPSVDDILKPTYGIIVYQEQIMKIAETFAGYTLSKADILRRAIAKKDKNIIEKEKDNFINSAISLGRDKNIAEKIYDYIEKFADYGFNRSHSVAYAILAYQMAYLKAHYYQSFMAVMMTYSTSNTEALLSYINQATQNGVNITKPDINYSNLNFTPYKNNIIPSLLMIKGIGAVVVEKILEERKKGHFENYQDFKTRNKGNINQKQLIALIHAGALDSFKLTHSTMLNDTKIEQSGFENFLEDFTVNNIEELSFLELKNNEHEVLGFNLNYDKDDQLNKLQLKYKLENVDINNTNIKVLAELVSVREHKTKNGSIMAFIKIKTPTLIDATIFKDTYNDYKNALVNKYLVFDMTKDEKGYIIRKIHKIKD